MIYSCKGCEKRYPGCHGKCEAYLADKAKHDALKAEYDRKKAIENIIVGQVIECTRRSMKRRRKGGSYDQ